ncbi:hypothetical protein GC177_04475 [bacterium]|nr:hypothetical protein [bacterium]
MQETASILWDTRLHGAPVPGVLHAPVMQVVPLTQSIGDFVAHYTKTPLPAIISSQTAMLLLADIMRQRHPQLIVTGQATARCAADLGIAAANAAAAMNMGEGMRAVADYIKERRIPACYYLSAEQTAFDIAQLEAWSGASIKPFVCYRTETADALPDDIRKNWLKIDGIVVGSLRTARALADLVRASGLSATGKAGFCRNADIAACLRERLDMEAFHHDGRGTGEDAFDAWLAKSWQQRVTLKTGSH